jgi:[acyl-carrier-protein] S-malonyltransferase
MSIQADQTAFLFPGQGSQVIGMGKDLCSEYSTARSVYACSDEVLGFPLSKICWEGPENLLNDTINAQPALLTHSVASLFVFNELFTDITPRFVAGHSLGEFSALVASKSMHFSDALLLVRKRGELMKKSGREKPGGMAAILGLDIQVLEKICLESSIGQNIVQVANDNCPGQVVISGSSEALQHAIYLAQQAGARRAIPLAVSIAAHSPLMSPIQEEFNISVNKSLIINPQIPIIGNVTASSLITNEQIRDDLISQLTSRVQWTKTIEFMSENGVDTFIELGTGAVLSGLVSRINKQAKCIHIGSPIDINNL